MAETVTVAGKQMNKKVVYVAGAGALGVVGYAYWTRRPTGPPTETKEIPEPVDVPTDTTDFGVTGGTTTAQPTNNADWSELAIARLMDIGLDGPAVSAALGKFLARRPLSVTEAGLVEQAIRAAGQPPIGGPWPIIRATTGGVTPPPTPTPRPSPGKHPPGPVRGLVGSSSRTTIRWRWQGVPYATHYKVIVEDGSGHDLRNVTTHATSYEVSGTNIRPGHAYRIRVRAERSGIGVGPYATHVTRTKR